MGVMCPKNIGNVMMVLALIWGTVHGMHLRDAYAQEGHRVFLSDENTDFVIDKMLQTALHDCANEDGQLTQQESLEKRHNCLVASVLQQATPDSLRRMVTTDLHRKMALLGKECKGATLRDQRLVVCQIHSILLGEHKKRLWAFGPIAEGNPPPRWRP